MNKTKNIALDLIGGQNHKFWVGSICGQKLEQYRAKTCRSRIQMLFPKTGIGAVLTSFCVVCVTKGVPSLNRTRVAQ